MGGHCPRCLAEYRPGFDTCYDCGVPLVPGPAPPPEEKKSGSDDPELADEVHPVSVASLPWEEAWLMAGRLRAEGIPARVYPDEYANPIVMAQALPVARELIAGVGLGRTVFEVMVPDDVAEQARVIVRRYAGA